MAKPKQQPSQATLTLQTVFFKCRRSIATRKETWVAWCSTLPMTNTDPCREPAEPLWFEWGATEGGTIKHLKACVELEIGKADWQRQEAW